MSKRSIAIAQARIAGYHGDVKAFTRLCIEARVARGVLQEAYSLGAVAQGNGVPCGCQECRPKPKVS